VQPCTTMSGRSDTNGAAASIVAAHTPPCRRRERAHRPPYARHQGSCPAPAERRDLGLLVVLLAGTISRALVDMGMAESRQGARRGPAQLGVGAR